MSGTFSAGSSCLPSLEWRTGSTWCRGDAPCSRAAAERLVPPDGAACDPIIVETLLPGDPLPVELLETVGGLRAERPLAQGADLGRRGAACPQLPFLVRETERRQGLGPGLP